MNVLFISISPINHMSQHSISQDLLREIRKRGHAVYVVCAIEKHEQKDTYLSTEADCQVLRVKIGNNKKANLIEKGITTITLPRKYIAAIKEYYSDVKFDLVLYPTPPITHVETVEYIKKRDGASSYLLLKDIFPQNAVDIGIMSKRGIKGFLYRRFRHIEKRLYSVSDRIGCMSAANREYVLKNNPEINPEKVEIFPNSIEPIAVSITEVEKEAIREKYAIPKDKVVFVYGGNLGRPQGIPFVIECLKKATSVNSAFFLIVGDGTEYSKLQKYVEENNPSNVKLMKRLPKEDYDRMIAACDVGLIFLDHRFTIPNFPSRLLAYMQASLPVLAATDINTDIGQVVSDGGFGWWCESNDADCFCSLVREAVSEDLEPLRERSYSYLTQHYLVEDTCSIIFNE